ncbi:prepilin [Escherichia coli DEC1B]|nr:prepilin [Escherichia coli DEC1B]
MFILRNKRKESGLSLIEASLVIILSGLVIVLVQSAISKIIKYAVHENALHDVSYVMSYIQDTLQTSCYGKENIVCDGVISSVKSNVNSGNKIKVDVKKTENMYLCIFYTPCQGTNILAEMKISVACYLRM